MSTPSSDLAGRIILITGGAGSLGRVAARACAEAGAQLVLLDKAVDRLAKFSDELVNDGLSAPALYPLDLAGAAENDYAQLAQVIESQFGQLDGLLHSAVEMGPLGPLTDLQGNAFERSLRVNLTAPHVLTRMLLPLLSQAGQSAVVFTTDSSARLGRAYWGAYGVTKIALEALAHMLADELESAGRIRVNLFAPGPVESTVRRLTHPGETEHQRLAPAALAGRYVFMLGPASRGMSGKLFEGPAPA